MTAWILNVGCDTPGRCVRSDLLRETDFRVIETNNPDEVFAILRDHDVSVVILPADIGPELCRQIKSNAETSATQVAVVAPKDDLPVDTSAGPDLLIRDPEDTPVVIGSIRSLTRLWGVVRQRQPDERFRRLADQATVGILTCDLHGEVEYCNAAFLLMLSLRNSDEIRNWHAVAGDLDFLPACLDRLQSGRKCSPSETILLNAQGERIPVLVNVAALEDDGNGAKRLAVYVTDLRPVREAERALRNSEEKQVLAVEAARMGTWYWDLRTDQVVWDDRCLRVFGLDLGTPVDYRLFLQLVHPDDREKTDRAVRGTLQNFSDYEAEYRVTHPNGETRWISARGRAQAGPQGQPERMQGIAIDITDRKRAEQRLHQLNDALQRSNRDLQEFAYAVSHDLQEPLRMVNNFGGLIQKRHSAGLEGEVAEFFEYMRDGAERMDRMIRDLLTYSRVLHDQGTFVAVELRAAFLWALSNLETSIQENNAIISVDDLPYVQGDFVRLSQVFQNLLSNAIKYRSPERPAIHVSARRQDTEWVISVRDNGIGMDPRYAPRAFGVFRRLHGSQYAGTGVGLAICKRIIERHGGTIWAQTAIGAGSTFFFTLPATDRPTDES